MFGSVTAVASTDEKILLADEQVPALRAYDHAGNHLFDIGGAREGPGEYRSLSSIAVASDGRVFVRDVRARRILIFAPDGRYLRALPAAGRLYSPTPMVLAADDVPYTLVIWGASSCTGDPVP